MQLLRQKLPETAKPNPPTKKVFLRAFYYALPALRPSDRTSVRSICSRHFSASFAANSFSGFTLPEQVFDLRCE